MKVLGIFISYGSVGNEQKNFSKKVNNLRTKLAAWRSRKIYLFGRCLIAKTLGLSEIVYSAFMLETPNKYASLIATFSILMEKQTR